MSMLAQVNGAQRETAGLYAGVDGVVRKLFEDNRLAQNFQVITAAQAGIKSEKWFDVSSYSIVLSIVSWRYSSSNTLYLFVVFPQLRITLKMYYKYDESSADRTTWENSIVSSAVKYEGSYGTFEYDPEQNTIKVERQEYTAFFI